MRPVRFRLGIRLVARIEAKPLDARPVGQSAHSFSFSPFLFHTTAYILLHTAVARGPAECPRQFGRCKNRGINLFETEKLLSVNLHLSSPCSIFSKPHLLFLVVSLESDEELRNPKTAKLVSKKIFLRLDALHRAQFLVLQRQLALGTMLCAAMNGWSLMMLRRRPGASAFVRLLSTTGRRGQQQQDGENLVVPVELVSDTL